MKEGYKKTELGWIPEEWEVRTIGKVTDIVNGCTPKTNVEEYWKEGNIKWATPTDITKTGKYICDTDKKITKRGFDESSLKLLPIGSILMSSRATIGERCINTIPMCTNQGFKSLICKDNINNEFMYYYIDILKDKMINLSSGSTFLELSKNTLSNLKIVIPPLKEQQKIAEILSTVDAQIDDTDKLIEKTKELKKGLMQRLLTKGIGHSEFKKSEVGEIPVEWDIVDLSEICDINPKKRLLEMDDDVSFVSMEHVSNDGKLLSYSIKKYKDVYKGYTAFENDDVLLAKITPCFENGKKAIVEDLVNGIGFGSTEFHVLRAKNKKSISKFIYYFVSTHRFREQAQLNMTGSAGQKRVPTNFLKDIKVMLPSLEEQIKITNILLSVDNQIEEYKDKKIKLKELKKGLMQQLLTGKIRVV